MKRLLLFTAAASLVACGPRTRDKTTPNNSANVDPNSGTANAQTNGEPNAATNNAMNVATNNQTTPNNTTNNQTTPPNNTTNNQTTPPNNNTNNQTTPPNNTTNNQTNNTTNNMTSCTPDLGYSGEIGGTDIHHGGFVTNTNTIGDASLSEAVAGTPPEPDDPTTPGVDEGTAVLTPPVAVSGAIVTATGPNGNQRFWLEDGFATVQVYLPQELPQTIRVGMEVSFEALEMQNFEGHAQISNIANFAVLSEDNGVPVREATNRALTDDDYGHIVRLGGKLNGPPVDCGGKDCWDFDYPGGTTVFRSGSDFTMDGSCVTYIGPVYAFPGFLQSGATPTLQLDTLNFDWMWIE